MGMQTLEVGGHHHDYMTILYQDDAKLFIPVSQLDKIQKYVSSESKTPRVNKLGGSEWAKTKRRVANKIEDIADELVDLYAKREAEKGYAFTPDDSYQKSSKMHFHIQKHQINCEVLKKLNKIWRRLSQWIDC